MERIRFDMILRADQPIAHHQEVFGNSAVIMRQRVRLPDGSFAHVPIVTGDTMRHGLRESAAWCLLSAAGMLGESLSEEALRLLFAGGMVTGSGSAVRLDEYRELVDLVPSMALLGGCAQNRVIPGRLESAAAILVCEESAHLLPSWVHEWLEAQGISIASARSHVEEVQRVRMDPTLDPAKQALLTEGARAAVAGRLLASEAASEQGDEAAGDRAKSSMMPRRHETIVQGSLLYWSIAADIYSELDRDSLMTMLGAFLRHARVGGKRGTGHGLLTPLVGRQVEIEPWEDKVRSLALVGPDQRVGELFRRHVGERAERVRDLLGRVAA